MGRRGLSVLAVVGLLVSPAVVLAGSDGPGKALVERFGVAVNEHDLAALDAIVAPDFVRHSQATPDVQVSSLEEFKAFLKANRAVSPDERVTLTQLVEEGDRVAFWGTYAATQEGQMGPFPPSGKKMNLDMAGVFRIADGKIAELWIVWDNLAALVQLGHYPPPGASQD
jgi:steroid delta-isomerase-like uncharacterized protein